MPARVPIKCPELSRLPKAKGLKSINFARQTPGSAAQLLSPRPSENVVDPTHPAAAARLSRSLFPTVQTDSVMVKAYPMAILEKPELEYTGPLKRTVESWESRVLRMTPASSATPSGTKGLDESNTRMGGEQGVVAVKKRRNDSPEPGSMLPLIKLNNERKGRVSMSFMHVGRSQKMGKINRCTRMRVIRKLKTTINYVVVRGANVETNSDGKKEIVFANNSTSVEESKWILRGWTYLFFPSLEVYLMPYHDLIPMMRNVLKEIWKKGTRLESKWEKSLPLQSKPDRRRRDDKRESTSSNRNSVENPAQDMLTQKIFRASPLSCQKQTSNAPTSKKVSTPMIQLEESSTP